MTQTKDTTVKKQISASLVRCLLPTFLCFVTIVFIVKSKTVALGVTEALGLCVRSVIPSIFPCMVLSRLIVGCGGGELFAKLFGGIVERVFGISRAAAAPIFLGALCGFPVGASVAEGLYRRGELTLSELEAMLGFISLPSPAFVINAVGMMMLGDRSKGIGLYVLIVSISFLIGIFVCRPLRKKHSYATVQLPAKQLPLSEITVDAIGGSAFSMLGVCAYMVFFAALSMSFRELLSLPPAFSALLGGVLEFSGGCYSASNLENSFSLCAFILGWSGIGVHFQVMSVSPKGISYKKFYLSVFLRAVLCFALSSVISSILDI